MSDNTGISWTGRKLGAMKRLASRVGVTLEEFAHRLTHGEKYCWRCRVTHPLSAFNTDVTRSDGLDPACADSRNKNSRDRYIPHPASRLGTFSAETRDGDKKQARSRVNHLVDVGLLPDPNDVPCTDCSHVYADGERRHEYDHYLGYAGKNQLDVQSVCTTCHRVREESRHG